MSVRSGSMDINDGHDETSYSGVTGTKLHGNGLRREYLSRI